MEQQMEWQTEQQMELQTELQMEWQMELQSCKRVQQQARQVRQTPAITSNKDFRYCESAMPALTKKSVLRVGWSCTKAQFREENVVDRCKEVLTSCF